MESLEDDKDWPQTPVIGQIHRKDCRLYFWDGRGWVAGEKDTKPGNPKVGEKYLDNVTQQEYLWVGDKWVPITKR